ncbi:MAG: ABC transporter ATP-binding protein, partial [Coprobacillaceae bacterium]
MAHNETNTTEKSASAPSFGPGGGSGGMGSEKAKDFSKTIKQLLAYCKEYLVVIVIAIVLACAGAIFNIIGPDKLGEITDLITNGLMEGIDLQAIANVGIFLAVLYGLGWLFNYIQSVIMAVVTQRISKKLRSDLTKKINALPLKYFDSSSHGDILSRVTNDVDTIGQSLNNSLGTLVTSITTFIGALIMMVLTNWIMALSAVLATIIGFALMMIIMKYSQKYFNSQQQQLGAVNGHMEEIYSGHTVVKAYNAENSAEQKFDTINTELYDSAWKSQFLSGLMMPIMSFIGNLGYVVVCIVGAVLAMNGDIGFGVIVSFMVYIRLFTSPLSQLAQVATNIQSAAAASERVFELLSEP